MAPPLALVTRPREDAGGIALALAERGFAVMTEPMLTLSFRTGVRLPLEGAQGYLATSANGVRALAAHQAPRTLPLWAVGEATARCARDLGFEAVASAEGDVASLAALVAGTVHAEDGALIHAAAAEIAGDLAGLLAEQGLTVRRVVLYDATPVTAFSPDLRSALAEGRIDCAFFFSPRTGRSFATLARGAGLTDKLGGVRAFALSRAVAGTLEELPWKSLRHAARPNQEALLALIETR